MQLLYVYYQFSFSLSVSSRRCIVRIVPSANLLCIIQLSCHFYKLLIIKYNYVDRGVFLFQKWIIFPKWECLICVLLLSFSGDINIVVCIDEMVSCNKFAVSKLPLPNTMAYLFRLYKNAYSGLSPAMWWLSFVMLINRAGTMVLPFLTLYLTQQLHYSIGMAGLMLAVYGAGAICGGILGGKLTDRLGFYNMQVAALLAGGLMFILLGQVTSFIPACICTFVLAMLNDSFRPANATAIAHYSTTANRTRCYSLNRLAINLGWAAGGALGGFIASVNYNLLFWIDGLTNISAAILLLLVLSPARNSATPSSKKVKTETAPAPSPYKDRPYLLFVVLTVLFGMCFFQMFATVPVFFNTRLHLSPSLIGAVMAMNGILIGVLEMPIVFTLEKRERLIETIIAGTLLCGLSFAMFNIVPGELSLAIVSTIVITIGEILAMPFMNTFWIGRTTAGNRGQYAGLYTVAWSVAQVIGPGLGGQVAQHFGYTTLWWAVGLTGAICALGFVWLRRVVTPGIPEVA